MNISWKTTFLIGLLFIVIALFLGLYIWYSFETDATQIGNVAGENIIPVAGQSATVKP